MRVRPELPVCGIQSLRCNGRDKAFATCMLKVAMPAYQSAYRPVSSRHIPVKSLHPLNAECRGDLVRHVPSWIGAQAKGIRAVKTSASVILTFLIQSVVATVCRCKDRAVSQLGLAVPPSVAPALQ